MWCLLFEIVKWLAARGGRLGWRCRCDVCFLKLWSGRQRYWTSSTCICVPLYIYVNLSCHKLQCRMFWKRLRHEVETSQQKQKVRSSCFLFHLSLHRIQFSNFFQIKPMWITANTKQNLSKFLIYSKCTKIYKNYEIRKNRPSWLEQQQQQKFSNFQQNLKISAVAAAPTTTDDFSEFRNFCTFCKFL